MLLLLLSEVGRGVRLRGGYAYAAGAAGAIVFAFAMYSNTSELESRAQYWANRASQTKAELAVLDLARGTVWPTFLAEDPAGQPPIPLANMPLDAGDYFRVADAYGSPAYSPEQLASLRVPVRQVADIVLARALALDLEPLRSLPRGAPHAPDVARPTPRSGRWGQGA